MQDGLIKVAAAAPSLRVGDPVYNTEQIMDSIRRAAGEGVRVLVFPQLCITGYTCQDLFFQPSLLDKAMECLSLLRSRTDTLDMLIAVGLPVQLGGRLCNCAALLHRGQLLGLVPKEQPQDDCGLTESRYFSPPPDWISPVEALDYALCDARLTFRCADLPGLSIGLRLGDSVPSADGDPAIVLHLAALPEDMSAPVKRRDRIRASSDSGLSAWVSANPGMGESTADQVYSGHCLVSEAGELVAEAKPFSRDWAVGEVDVEYLAFLRRKKPGFVSCADCPEVTFSMEQMRTAISRTWEPMPFVPAGVYGRAARCEHVLNIQAWGLKKRMEHVGAKCAVIGISGGLDSTLALIVIQRAMELMDRPMEDILAYTLPCFGTSHRTRSNAEELCLALGIRLQTIDITAAVRQHFADIGQDEGVYDAAFENSQARERTQILMDIANQKHGIVIGTGDLSELALGWATYNGDHMSMYGVNGSVPKTLIRDVIGYLSESCENQALSTVLADILDTPVSPELVPGEDGQIAQRTEELVGDYRLHDFFLWHCLNRGCGPKKLYRVACRAFEGMFEPAVILKGLRIFFRRFLSQQFKRSCMPDGPGVSGLSLSPRGGLSLPSDLSSALWMAELEEIEP